MKQHMIQLVECPRDAMQGWPHQIPTAQKIAYLNSLLQVGFHTLDFGSFVSPKAIPQMADKKEVLAALQVKDSPTKLLAIVANSRGAEEAVKYEEINFLGFPFSISETFQKRNTNSSIAESLEKVREIQCLCLQSNKQLVIYLSMGFGNPYGDIYNMDILLKWVDTMVEMGIQTISLADTVGLAKPEQISLALDKLIPAYPQMIIGVHLHASEANWQQKLAAAVDSGCTRIDGALKGIGGCPMAGNELVGNMDTEKIIHYLEEKGLAPVLNQNALEKSLRIAAEIFI